MRVAETLQRALADFKRRGIPEAKANAEILMASVLRVGRNEVFLKRARALNRRESAAFGRFIRQRLCRIPVAHILGSQAFLDFEVAASPHALIPRPETEELAAAAMKALEPRRLQALRIWDLGTGTGCLAIALARFFPKARILAVDISRLAVNLSRRNAKANGISRRISVQRDDFLKSRKGSRPRASAWADLVVSNPPYIPTRQIAKLAPEVRREPRLALDGGGDGLAAIEAVIARAQEALKPGSVLALEFGWNQARRVTALLRAHGFTRVEILRDAQGVQRIAVAFNARL